MIWGSGEAPHFSPPPTPGIRPTTSANGTGNESSIWGLGDVKSSEQPPALKVDKSTNILEKRNKSFPVPSHGRGLYQSHTRTQQRSPNTRTHTQPQPRSPDSFADSNVARGTEGSVTGSEYSGDGSETEHAVESVRADWPLPITSVGMLTLEHRVRR